MKLASWSRDPSHLRFKSNRALFASSCPRIGLYIYYLSWKVERFCERLNSKVSAKEIATFLSSTKQLHDEPFPESQKSLLYLLCLRTFCVIVLIVWSPGRQTQASVPSRNSSGFVHDIYCTNAKPSPLAGSGVTMSNRISTFPRSEASRYLREIG